MKKTFSLSRLIAVALTLAMVVSCAGAIPFVSVSAANPNFDGYITNGDFEAGSGNWNLNSTSSIVSGGHDGSGSCLRLAGGKWANINQSITVEPNTDYRLSGWVKREAGTGAHYLFAKRGSDSCTAINGSQQWFTYTNSGWVQHIWDFNSGDTLSIMIVMCVEDPDSVFLYDDIMLQKISDIAPEGQLGNTGFETGGAGPWFGSSAATVVSGGRNDSAYAMKLQGGPGLGFKQTVSVKGMTDYRITFYAKRQRSSGDHRIFVKSGEKVLEPINGTDGVIGDTVREWIEHVYEFNSGFSTQVTVFLQVVDNGANFLYDDIVLEEIALPYYEGVLKGDATLDGEITDADLALLRRHIAGEVTLENEALYAADMNCDGEADSADAAMLGKYLESGDTTAIPIYPINGETVAKGAWQVEALLGEYTPGMTDEYSGIAHRKDQYMRDPVVLRWITATPQRSYNVLIADNPDMRNAKTYLSQETTLEVQNLLVDTDYYWAVEMGGVRSDVGTFHTAKTVRTFWIEGVSNTRDVGGWLTEVGEYRVKYDVVFRGARFDEITDAGRAAVEDLGIKTDIDLRADGEGATAPLGSGVRFFRAGKKGAAMYYMYDNRTISDFDGDYVPGTANAMTVFADADNFPAYFHCSYGRDRTGTLAFLLLGVLGVSREDIERDYEMTYLSFYGGGGIAVTGYIQNLINMIDWVQETYAPEGTLKEACAGYLRAIGITDAQITAIRANLLEPVNAPAPAATGIGVTTLPTKLSYVEGEEEFDSAGGMITVYYDNESSEEIALTADMVSGFDNTLVGSQTLTVTYGDFTATFEIEITANILPGDADGNGEVTVADALVSLRAAVGLTEATPELLAVCDVDGDGEITVSDALRILRAAAGLVDRA